jgi:hypothetical protein
MSFKEIVTSWKYRKAVKSVVQEMAKQYELTWRKHQTQGTSSDV